MKINEFLGVFRHINKAAGILAGEIVESFTDEEIGLITQSIDECYSTRYCEALDDIENKLNVCQDKELYIWNIFKKFSSLGFREPSKYLNIELGADNNPITGKRVNASRDLIRAYWLNPVVFDDFASQYIVWCWELLGSFVKRFDELCMSYGVDIINLQEKYKSFIWYRVNAGIPVIPVIKTIKEPVIPEKAEKKFDKNAFLMQRKFSEKLYKHYGKDDNYMEYYLKDICDAMNPKKQKLNLGGVCLVLHEAKIFKIQNFSDLMKFLAGYWDIELPKDMRPNKYKKKAEEFKLKYFSVITPL